MCRVARNHLMPKRKKFYLEFIKLGRNCQRLILFTDLKRGTGYNKPVNAMLAYNIKESLHLLTKLLPSIPSITKI
jgi:hypothetical protein